MKKMHVKLMSGFLSGLLAVGLLSPVLPSGVVHAQESDTGEVSGIDSDISGQIDAALNELYEKHNEINNKIESAEQKLNEKNEEISNILGSISDEIVSNIGKVSNKDECTIIASAGRGGTISDAGEKTYRTGESVTYNITANSGYEIYFVTVDGISMGTINNYTFSDLKKNHSICAHFIRKADNTSISASKHSLAVIGSFSSDSGSGIYQSGATVAIQSGKLDGYIFDGWEFSDGRKFKDNKITITMPDYNLTVSAKWKYNGGVTNGLLQMEKTTNLKGIQAVTWDAIASKLDTLIIEDLTDEYTLKVLEVDISGVGCFVNQNVINHLDFCTAAAMRVHHNDDVNFVFYSDLDNSEFTGTDFTYTSSTSVNDQVKEKSIKFNTTGAIGTAVCVNTKLPGAVPGQVAYVYLKTGDVMQLYAPVAVDAVGEVSIPVSAKADMIIQY